MIDRPLDLEPPAAAAYAEHFGRALDALRLNRQFPDWERVRAHLSAAAKRAPGDPLRIDRASGLPVPREWIRARVEAELRADAALLPAREVQVALRNLHDGLASYAVRVDRLDVATATLARYSMIIADRPGNVVSEGELALRAAEQFQRKLELLSTQDAALAFAALQEEGLAVEDVVRGVIGPASVPAGVDGAAGPPLPTHALVLSACLERASVDLVGQRVDDPLAESVTISAGHFGLTRARKWAAEHADLPPLRAWLTGRGSRGLVYGYAA